LKNSQFEIYFGRRKQISKVQAAQEQLLHKGSSGPRQLKIVMAYYLQMLQSLNQDMNAMPVITLNALNGQPVRWQSALGHQVPVTSTAQCHPRRLSAVLRANLNRVDGTATELKTPQLGPSIFSLQRHHT
jgi:hypothetical protein